MYKLSENIQMAFCYKCKSTELRAACAPVNAIHLLTALNIVSLSKL